MNKHQIKVFEQLLSKSYFSFRYPKYTLRLCFSQNVIYTLKVHYFSSKKCIYVHIKEYLHNIYL